MASTTQTQNITYTVNVGNPQTAQVTTVYQVNPDGSYEIISKSDNPAFSVDVRAEDPEAAINAYEDKLKTLGPPGSAQRALGAATDLAFNPAAAYDTLTSLSQKGTGADKTPSVTNNDTAANTASNTSTVDSSTPVTATTANNVADPNNNPTNPTVSTEPPPSTGTQASNVPTDAAPATPPASQGSPTTTSCGITMSYSATDEKYTLTLPSGKTLQSNDPNALTISDAGDSIKFGGTTVRYDITAPENKADVSALVCQSQHLGDIATAAAAAKNGATPAQGTAPQDVSPEQQGQENEEESEENIENDGEDTNSEDDVPSQVVKTRNQSALGNANNVQLNNDWRVRLSLAAGSPPILYNANPAGILAPLAVTNGVIFPYTPDIQIQYSASYEGFNPTHSNYKIYQYQNSSVDTVTINCPFTAQDTNDATYVLAVIHFFRTLTKMFYGQDQTIRPGTPPPLVYLYGLGTFQFNNHPLVISGFNYSLPNDVDYIRVATPSVNANVPVKTDGYNPSPQQLQAIRNLGGTLSPGGQPPAANFGSPPAGSIQPTYVPTMMSMSITCYPIVSRNDVSNTFSLEQYATGELIQRGFW
jgi:hypothetical protein